MNHFTFSGPPALTVNYVACRHTPVRTHITGFDTLAEARQYMTSQEVSRSATNLTLSIVQTHDDRVVYYQHWSKPRLLSRLLSFFL